MCDGKNLNVTPQFHAVDEEMLTKMDINLQNNEITRLHANAFRELQFTSITELKLVLSNNNISVIDEDSFTGIEHILTDLSLDNNSLTNIPKAFNTLTSLTVLRINQNPLKSLASPALPALGRSLATLVISMDMFRDWPTELRRFRKLSHLLVEGYKQPTIPSKAFAGFEDTLTTLEIIGTGLEGIPSATCRLPNLQVLSYVSNPNTVHPIPVCDQVMSSVEVLRIINSSLTSFPDIFRLCDRLNFLGLNQNFIDTIEEGLIPNDNSVSELDLSKNHLRKIPEAIGRFQRLELLYLNHNAIGTIADSNLFSLTHLSLLQLSHNPLTDVSAMAFQSQTKIGLLDFSYTNLTEIPQAVTSLSSTFQLDLTGAPVICNCNMTHLENYASMPVITGRCAGSDETETSISYYLQNVLPTCS